MSQNVTLPATISAAQSLAVEALASNERRDMQRSAFRVRLFRIFLSAQQLVRAPRGVSGTAARSETDTTAKAAVTNDLGLIATTILTGHRRDDTSPRAPSGERLRPCFTRCNPSTPVERSPSSRDRKTSSRKRWDHDTY
jgi:hypothetical protein